MTKAIDGIKFESPLSIYTGFHIVSFNKNHNI